MSFFIGALKIKTDKKMIDDISRDIANEKYNWLKMFQSGKLKSHSMLPYVLFYYNVQDQVNLIKAYIDYINDIDC